MKNPVNLHSDKKANRPPLSKPTLSSNRTDTITNLYRFVIAKYEAIIMLLEQGERLEPA